MNYMMTSLQSRPTRLFDTSVFIDHLRGQNRVATQLILAAVKGEHPAAFSIVTDAELWAGVKTPQDDHNYRLLLGKLSRLPITLPIARLAGKYRRIHQINLIDALIAATAEIYALPVYTRNAEHFQRVTTITTIVY